MTTFNTGNPLGSTDVYDRYDNSENLDNFSNGPLDAYPDRFGVSRQSLQGIRNASQYVILGAYAAGLNFTAQNQVFSYLGEFYSPGPSITLPYTTTGAGAGEIANFRSVGDAVLRGDLLDPTKGSGIITYQPGITVEDALDDAAALADDVAALQVIAAEYVRPQDFGAVGDGVADDTAALLACLSDGRPVYLGNYSKNYRTTAEIDFAAASPVVIRSDGAVISADPVSAIRSVVKIDLAGNPVDISGAMTIACQDNSFTGLLLTNYGVSVDEARVTVSGLTVSDCYRSSLAHTGGDGIFIAGRLSQVLVDNVYIDGVKMATGAGVIGVQGVAGITVARDNTNGHDAALINITNTQVRRVFSEDVAYKADQDGVKVFTMYSSAGDKPRQVFASIRGCRFYNCHGRAVKIQSEFVSVSDCKIDRDSSIYSAYVGNSDIDFQVGGGQVSNIQANYDGNAPDRVVQFTLTQTDTRVNPTAAQITDFIVNQVGAGTGIQRFASVTTDFDASSQVSINSVNINGSKTPDYLLTIQSLVTNGHYGVNVSGVLSRLGIACVQRLGVAAPSWITGCSIINVGSSVPFAQATNAGSFTTSLIGANRLVT